MERLTRPFRYPKRVPVTRAPAAAPRVSGRRPPGREGSLQAGVMMGKDRKTERKTRNTLTGLVFFLEMGWRRVKAWGGGVAEDEEEDEVGVCGGV